MNKSTLLIHGMWAVLAVGAFLVGFGGHSKVSATAPEESVEETGSGGRAVTSRSSYSSWTSGPGDSASAFRREVTSVLAETNEERRKERAAALMGELTPQVWDGLTNEMVPELLQLFEEADFSDTWHKQKSFFGAWARVNPEAAFAYVTDPENKFGGDAWGRPAVVQEWAKSDLPSLQSAILGLEQNYSRYSMAHKLMAHLSKTDLDAAIAFSEEYEKSNSYGTHAGAGTLAKRLLDERGVGSVQNWLNGIDFGEATNGYKKEALEHLAYSRTGDGMSELLAARENQSFVDSELLGKIANWAAGNEGAEDRAKGKLDWLVKLPPEVGSQRQTIGEQFENYLKQDFKAAGEWLTGQDLGPAHDEAIEIFVRSATMDDVPAAMLWAQRISDPVLRAETISFVEERGGDGR